MNIRFHNTNSVACREFSQRINEIIVASGYNLMPMVSNYLKNQKVMLSPANKAQLGITANNMYQIHKPFLDAWPYMNFIYLCSLYENFFKKYFSEREKINFQDVSSHFALEQSHWNSSVSSNQKNKSTSFYNVCYVNFLLQSKYKLDIKKDCLNGNNDDYEILELCGLMRNCIVHRNGCIHSQADQGLDTYIHNSINNGNKYFTSFNVNDPSIKIDLTRVSDMGRLFDKLAKGMDYK